MSVPHILSINKWVAKRDAKESLTALNTGVHVCDEEEVARGGDEEEVARE